MTKKLKLEDAFKAVMEKKDFGAHVFYYPADDYFMVLRDSQNGEYAGDRADKDKSSYHGFIQDAKSRRRNTPKDAPLSAGHVFFELLSVLELSSHNFSEQLARIISIDIKTKADIDGKGGNND